MQERRFWLSAPLYIVICVLLGFVIAGLLTQNLLLKQQLEDANGKITQIQEAQAAQKKRDEATKAQADRIIAYLRCVSLTPVESRTRALIDKCLTEDLPPQLGGPSEPSGETKSGGEPVENSDGSRSQANTNTGNTPNSQNPGNSGGSDNDGNAGTGDDRTGLLSPITTPVCTNLAPRTCATLGL